MEKTKGEGKMTKGEGLNITIYDIAKNKYISCPINECIVQILAYEVEEGFHIEVLKAYAIMIRTYIMRKMKLFDGKGCTRYPRADICTNPDHCIGFLPLECISAEKRKQLMGVVNDTHNKVITFKGKIIFPYYHNTCGGSTENSERVLSNTIQYARKVLCDYCKSTSPHWQTIVEFTLEELETKFNIVFPPPSPLEETSIDKILYKAERDSEGRIVRVNIGDRIIKGRDFQERLDLFSTRFGWQPTGIRFFVRGKGHGLGLCSYGAQGLAEEGKSGEEILKYYFTGIKIEDIPQLSINKPLRGKIILIDPGHGGRDFGISKNNVIEKDMNLRISRKLEDLLVRAGAEVVLTRKGDKYLSLEERLQLSDAVAPHFILSIHGNDSPTMSNITQIYVYPGDREAKELGSFIIKEFQNYCLKSKDVVEIELSITRESKKTILVLDIGYFNLKDKEIDRIGLAIYGGILNYWGLNWENKG